MSVAIVEGGVPGGGATSAGMGHVVVMDDSPAQLALSAYSRELWRAEAASLPAEVEYVSRGTVWVASDEEEMAAAEAKGATMRAAGVAARMLAAAELRAEEPELREGLAGGLLVPEDGVSRPPAASAYLLSEAVRLGAALYRAKAVRAGESKVELADGRVLRGARIVLAVGNECELLPGLPIRRRKGHLAMTEKAPPGFLRHQVVELGYVKSAGASDGDSVAFNVQPRFTGEVVIGSSRQFGAEEPEVEDEILGRMLERAYGFMPGLHGLALKQVWTGFRAATPDHLPLLGPAEGLSEDATLWLAAGFEGLGTTCSLGAARVLVDQMLGRVGAIELTPYLASRFGR
jgi:glycine/D-amino acid oxidase-like deaminating enzyme